MSVELAPSALRIPRPPVRRHGSSPSRAETAHTLVELMVAMCLAGVALSALYVARLSDSILPSVGATSREVLSLDGMVHKMVVEIQEATRLVLPQPGKGRHQGLALVDADGEVIIYYLGPKPGSDLNWLHRRNANRDRKAPLMNAPPYMDNVRHFKVEVASAENGKEPSLVNLDLAVQVEGSDANHPRLLNYVTSAYLRGFERYIPDDLFPAGTPLADVARPR